MEPTRKFKIIVNSKECGTCSGPTPSSVAKKVVKKLCGTSSKVVKFSLKECKRGCERVCGPYQGRMEKLDRPYKRDGKTITHRVVCEKVRKMRGGEPNFSIIKKDIKNKLIALKQQIYPINNNYPEQRRIEFLKKINKTTKKELLKLYNNKFIEYHVNDPLQNNRYQTNNNHHQKKLEHFNEYLQTIIDEIISEQINVDLHRTDQKYKRYGINKKYLQIYLYENIDDKNPKYSIINFNLIIFHNVSQRNGLTIYRVPVQSANNSNNYRVPVQSANNSNNYPIITSNNINTTGLCNFLKNEYWVYKNENKFNTQTGKLIDILRKYDNTDVFKSLKVLDSMCPELQPFNQITTN